MRLIFENGEFKRPANGYRVSDKERTVEYMTLRQAADGREYTVRSINVDDDEVQSFLFSLGCYSGEKITVVSHLRGSCVVAIKDGRYSIDNRLADAIKVLA